MPTKLIIDKEQRVVFIRRTGRVDFKEMMGGTKKLESSPFSPEVEKALSDLSDADFSDISNSEIMSYGNYCKKSLKKIKIAIVAPQDLSYGIARMLEILSNVENIMVFRKMDKALSWLDVVLPEGF